MAGLYADSAQRLVSGAFQRGQRATSGLDMPGPALPTADPFRPGTVTGGGIVLKAVANLLAGRRAAANAQEIATAKAAQQKRLDLTTQLLQQKLTPQPTRDVPVPGTGLTVKASDQDLMKNPGAFRTPREPAGSSPVHVPADYAKKLEIPYDEATGTVSPADIRANAPRLLQGAIEARSTRSYQQRERFHGDSQANFQTREGQALAHAELASLDAMEKTRVADEARQADEAAAKAQLRHEAAGRVLQSPGESIQNRSGAARMLAVPYLRDQRGNVVTDPATHKPMYDITKIPGAIKAATASARQQALTQARSANAAARLYYGSRQRDIYSGLAGATSNQPEGPDPLLQNLGPLFQMYGITPQPATQDTSEGGIDQRAY